MARAGVIADEEFAIKLSKLAASTEVVAEKALKAGAKIIEDKVRSNLEALPTDYRTHGNRKYHYLYGGEEFDAVPIAQKEDLLDSLGTSPMQRDANGDFNVKVGFAGYGRQKTAKYPNGMPNQLIARSINSGSSVRARTQFMSRAARSTKKKAIEEMNRVINDAYEKIMKD